MKQFEYIEGLKALENFKRGMESLFKVPKDAVVKAEKKKQKNLRASQPRKTKLSDKD